MYELFKFIKNYIINKKNLNYIFNLLWIIAVMTFIPIFEFPKLFSAFHLKSTSFFQFINSNYDLLYSIASILFIFQLIIGLLFLLTFRICNTFKKLDDFKCFLAKIIEYTITFFLCFALIIQIFNNINILDYGLLTLAKDYLLKITFSHLVCSIVMCINFLSVIFKISIAFSSDT